VSEDGCLSVTGDILVPLMCVADGRKQQSVRKVPIQVHYKLFLGADLDLFSTAKAEEAFKNMHEPNHRELAISKFASRVADVLWPGCQEDIDETIAKHKVMVSKTRIHIPEPEYQPPNVPHILPFTSWYAPMNCFLFLCVRSSGAWRARTPTCAVYIRPASLRLFVQDSKLSITARVICLRAWHMLQATHGVVQPQRWHGAIWVVHRRLAGRSSILQAFLRRSPASPGHLISASGCEACQLVRPPVLVEVAWVGVRPFTACK
jgi:hypothetical protein